ncbi:MAG: hypothetical protein FP824_01905 [Euryarchaeota archaeon]|nr:hypothetical protein [Euryarchaeota archaeon]MBU4072080.1 hypothetical protein [Candidatus Thermoplasmatota archaeon]MBU4143390.1 hypothetical protein [Candidatus Thermoplasmatota archaeon]
MSAAEIDALKAIHETEKRSEEIVHVAEIEAERTITNSRLVTSKRFNQAEAMLEQEAAKHLNTSVAEAEVAIAKLMSECEADISSTKRLANERRENAIQQLKVLILEWR